jgi:hypothetical protein
LLKESLFIVCRRINELAVLDFKTGRVIDSIPIGKKVDGVYFDEPNHLIICSGGDGTLTFIKQKNYWKKMPIKRRTQIIMYGYERNLF